MLDVELGTRPVRVDRDAYEAQGLIEVAVDLRGTGKTVRCQGGRRWGLPIDGSGGKTPGNRKREIGKQTG